MSAEKKKDTGSSNNIKLDPNILKEIGNKKRKGLSGIKSNPEKLKGKGENNPERETKEPDEYPEFKGDNEEDKTAKLRERIIKSYGEEKTVLDKIENLKKKINILEERNEKNIKFIRKEYDELTPVFDQLCESDTDIIKRDTYEKIEKIFLELESYLQELRTQENKNTPEISSKEDEEDDRIKSELDQTNDYNELESKFNAIKASVNQLYLYCTEKTKKEQRFDLIDKRLKSSINSAVNNLKELIDSIKPEFEKWFPWKKDKTPISHEDLKKIESVAESLSFGLQEHENEILENEKKRTENKPDENEIAITKHALEFFEKQ